MRIVFFCTPNFAVASLEKLLINKINVVAVVTSPDRPSGRGLQLTQSAIKQFCLINNLRVLQPTKLKDETFLTELKNINADLHLVVAFRMLPEQVWNMPVLGTYNLHASLLPKYRGAAPINWAIINGEKETGVSTFKLQHQIDTGNILLQETVSITDEMNAGDLHDTLMKLGAELLLKTVQLIESAFANKRQLQFILQDETKVCHAPKLNKNNCMIDWSKSAEELYNLVRGLSPYPAAYTNLISENAKPLNFKIFSSTYLLKEHQETNGSLDTDNKNYIHVFCSKGVLILDEIQLEGKKRMSTKDFLRGYQLIESAILR